MRTRLAGILFAVLALGACADGARLSTLPTITPYYNPTLVWHATRDGGMQTVIYGNPFKSSHAITELDLIALATGPNDPAFEQLLRNLVDELLPAYGTPKQFGQPGF